MSVRSWSKGRQGGVRAHREVHFRLWRVCLLRLLLQRRYRSSGARDAWAVLGRLVILGLLVWGRGPFLPQRTSATGHLASAP